MTRRDFFARAAQGFAISASSYKRILGANNRVRVGIVGCGMMGWGHIDAVSGMPDAEVAGLCDVWEHNLALAREKTVKHERPVPLSACVKDYRRILDDRSIDVVCIATPDHWHAILAVEACKAGKDVYVEKPMCHRAHEMTVMRKAAERYGREIWSGQMQFTWNNFQAATNWVQCGRIGMIRKLHTWLYWGMPNMGRPPFIPPPKDLGQHGWDMWCGPAPLPRRQKPNFRWDLFQVNPPEMGERKSWATWRLNLDYGGGMHDDWGAHSFAHHLHAMLGPALDPSCGAKGMPDAATVSPIVRVTCDGGITCAGDFRTAPDTFKSVFDFGAFAIVWEHDACNPAHQKKRDWGIEFTGASGLKVFIDREFAAIFDGEREVERINHHAAENRWRLFLESVRTRHLHGACSIRTEPIWLSNVLCSLGVAAYRLQKNIGTREILWNWRENKNLTPEAEPYLTASSRGKRRLTL